MGLAAQSEWQDAGSVHVQTIHMGDFTARDDDSEIRTLLGSCVCVCLWDPYTRIGGANHFQLPDAPDHDRSARYGVHAMEKLINQMMALGADRSRLVALAFGGAGVIRALTGYHVGARNAAFAREFLATEGIPLRGGDLGGRSARQVRFRVRTGEGSVITLPAVESSHVAASEAGQRVSPSDSFGTAEGGHVDFF